ncbi:MAG: hypothetical protein GWN01_17355, partial [Nitrosopumilaceae archaeon]|nr:hypothetical protein [Nitrosopumilaceae archaeon]NIU89059.1 hypothetical protein [Nitrosopumilaceae archaeon]NIV67156.1 hypothetical protein [Nitrosopumilaceae archaeon]NIX63195.1 hypothetical protein [Nitrosopumilaceae archaeon]
RVQGTFKGKKFTYKELFYEDGGLKDASWVDMFLMDTTNGIFSHNGIIPQVCMSVLQDAIETNLVYAKEIENDINNIIGKLE